MHNYLINDYNLDLIVENFNDFFNYINRDLNNDYENLPEYIKFFENTLEQLESASKDEDINIQFIIAVDILSVQLNKIKEGHLLSYPNHSLDGVREMILHLLHFIKKLDKFLKQHNKRRAYTYGFNDIEYLLSNLTTFYTELDFTPNQLEDYHILNFDIFLKVFYSVCKGLEAEEISIIETKSLELYQVTYDVFYRHIGNMYNDDIADNFTKLCEIIEVFVIKVLKIDVSEFVTNDYIGDEGLDPLPFDPNVMTLESLEREVEEEKKAEEQKKIELSNNSTENTDPDMEQNIESLEIEQLKTRFLFLYELGVIDTIEAKFKSKDIDYKDIHIASVVATILEIKNDSQRKSLRAYVRDCRNKPNFYNKDQKSLIQKLMFNLNLIKLD